MAANFNLHRLFHVDDGYLKKLRVPEADQHALSIAREEIRSTLRAAFRSWQDYVPRAELLDEVLAKSDVTPDFAAPKFRVQGSFCYHTANDPQQLPPQQVDQDDGMFLPVSFITAGGSVRPGIASKSYFKIVEKALEPLCKRKGWVLNPDGGTRSCVRVELNSRLHIDIPLYAVQDDAFSELVESSINRMAKAADAAFVEEAELSEDVYGGLDESEIMLAHREKGWMGSDPRKLERWFQNAIETYGPSVRRVSRAYKGLRDSLWSDCDLGSICIMAAVVKAFERLGEQDENRIDLAILGVGRELVKILAGPIENPAFPGDPDKFLCNGWEPEFRAEVRKAFQDACDLLEQAIFEAANKEQALRVVRQAFGDRVPNDISLIGLVGTVQVIRDTKPTPQPKQVVPRTQSG
jgi:hypothetical protein